MYASHGVTQGEGRPWVLRHVIAKMGMTPSSFFHPTLKQGVNLSLQVQKWRQKYLYLTIRDIMAIISFVIIGTSLPSRIFSATFSAISAGMVWWHWTWARLWWEIMWWKCTQVRRVKDFVEENDQELGTYFGICVPGVCWAKEVPDEQLN